ALLHATEKPAGLSVLRMDMAEAGELAGRRMASTEEIARFARALREKGVAEIVMIAAGAQGTVIACDAWCGLTRPPVVVPLSKIGAGDSFIGAFALAISRDDDPVTAAAWGTAAAASAVTTEGTELCRREETERFFREVTRTPL
ncbi:MAG: PfkB family carbohydrate kinase, partial [Pseudomonadota bacterium]